MESDRFVFACLFVCLFVSLLPNGETRTPYDSLSMLSASTVTLADY